MLRAIKHAFARRKGGHSPAAPTPVSAERRPASTSTPSPVRSSGSIEFIGVSFPVMWTVADFIATTASLDRVALRLRTEQYATHMRDIMRQFGSKYAPSSPEYQAFKHTSLVCASCGWLFPGSYTLSLIGAVNGYTTVVGATPGYAEFGKTGTCTKCGSEESFLIYQHYKPPSISQADVDAIRRYWRHLAQQWWSNNTSSSTPLCDACNDYVSQAKTYLIGGRLECERCTDKELVDGLNKLRRDPFYFGDMELQKARSFVVGTVG
ncbi:hypothetical protein M378DRAFT_751599 [Amanita muscaria Koide BX008]|uniref:Uncharacterized protein n=1 Tax=Amanita muscaria (strain Koide BX008) TaxID=946122 RepID=A0A0C2T7P0_AMAMK|nr:hypothetical protein M378DRAFT_751599 [Amanita muscaria Koide BX008]